MEVSDVKTMREALKKIADLTEPCEGVTSCEVEVNVVAKEALVAPPRNLERFANADEAKKYVKENLKVNTISGKFAIDGIEVETPIDWLFSVYKGGKHGSE